MRRSLTQMVVLLAISALLSGGFQDQPLTSDFSIAGVRLGMSRTQVEAMLGETSEADERSALYTPSDEGTIYVTYGDFDRVERVTGQYLEYGSEVLAKPWPDFEEDALARVVAIIGEPDYSDEPGDLTWNHWFEKQNLIVQLGCGGWNFFLCEL